MLDSDRESLPTHLHQKALNTEFEFEMIQQIGLGGFKREASVRECKDGSWNKKYKTTYMNITMLTTPIGVKPTQ